MTENPDGNKFRNDSFVHVLLGDVVKVMEQLSEESTDFQRRTSIRTIFAAIEGLLTVARNGMSSLPLTCAEASVLKEEAYEVGNRGAIQTRSKYIPLDRNIKAIVKIVRRVRPEYELDFDHPGWACLQRSLQVRHRLTHPKTLEDLGVNRDEISEAHRGFYWFLAFTIEVMEKTKQSLTEQVSKPGH